MHLLKAQPGVVADGSEAVDLGQTPGDIVVLSAADTELASLAAARATLGETFPAVRLGKPHAALAQRVGGSVLRGRSSPKPGSSSCACSEASPTGPTGSSRLPRPVPLPGATLVLLPGDDQPDPELAAHSTADTGGVPAALELSAPRWRRQRQELPRLRRDASSDAGSSGWNRPSCRGPASGGRTWTTPAWPTCDRCGRRTGRPPRSSSIAPWCRRTTSRRCGRSSRRSAATESTACPCTARA